jgi:mannose-6-phosphate isomerase-like protein (cupin superfamily)
MVKKEAKNGDYCDNSHNIIIWDLLNQKREDNIPEIDYKIVYVTLKPGESSIVYKLQNNSVIYFILEGKGLMHINNDEEEFHGVQVIYISPNSKHYIENTEDRELKFLRIFYPVKNDLKISP